MTVPALVALALLLAGCSSPQPDSGAPGNARAGMTGGPAALDDGRGGDVEHGDEELHADDHDEGRDDNHDGGHDGGHGAEAGETVAVELSPAQREAAGIRTELLTPRTLDVALRAPGEVLLNAYATYQVTPRIRAQVVARHARLGDAIAAGQPLVTMSSVAMAEAQGALIVAEREWARVQTLGRDVVSERRYIEAQVDAQQARARVLAFGMVDEQIRSLVESGDASLAQGDFTLLAPYGGTVVRDDFVVGESIEPGRTMFEITDESTLWVEARLPAQQTAAFAEDSPARVGIGGRWIDGHVIQAFHALDESTRTLPIRVQIPNPEDELHPGMFVDVLIMDEDSEPVLAIPEAAVLRGADGDWQVFTVNPDDGFEPVEVQIERTAAGLAVVAGIAPGTRVVTEGAFFVQSEYAKTGFSIHNH